jgi:hypothetical protein
MNNHDDDRLIDEMLGAYVEWREACAALAGAYARWAQEIPAGGGDAFRTYRRALDIEERAAERYADRTRRVTRNRIADRDSILRGAVRHP